MVGGDSNDGGTDSEVLDDVRTPAMTALVDLRTDDTLRIQACSLRLHTLHGQFAGIIERLGLVGHFDVLADLLHPLDYTLVGNMVDTVTHHHAHGPVTGLEQGPEILA